MHSEEIELWLVTKISRILEVRPIDIDTKENFHFFGLNSLQMFDIFDELTIWLEFYVSYEVIANYSNIKILSEHLSEKVNKIEKSYND